MLQFWKVRNIPFWERRGLHNSPQKLKAFVQHSYSYLSWFEVPPMLWVWDIIYISGDLSNWQIITCMTMHNHSCSIDRYINVEDLKCHNFGSLGISHFEKEWPRPSGQLDPNYYHSWPLNSYIRGYVWAQVNWTQVSTTLALYMPLLRGTSELRSTGPRFVPLLAMWWCYKGSTSDLYSTGPMLVPLLALRGHYQWGTFDQRSTWPNDKLTWCSTILGH